MEVDFVDNESMRKKGQENILDDEKDAVWLSSILRYNKRLTFVTGQRLIQNSFLIIVCTYIIIGLFMMQFENLAEYESIDRTKKKKTTTISHYVIYHIFIKSNSRFPPSSPDHLRISVFTSVFDLWYSINFYLFIFLIIISFCLSVSPRLLWFRLHS